jgi:CBS domain-containing protein
MDQPHKILQALAVLEQHQVFLVRLLITQAVVAVVGFKRLLLGMVTAQDLLEAQVVERAVLALQALPITQPQILVLAVAAPATATVAMAALA